MNKFLARGCVTFCGIVLLVTFGSSVRVFAEPSEKPGENKDFVPVFKGENDRKLWLTSSDGVFEFIVDETGKYAKLMWCSKNEETVVIPSEVTRDGKSYKVFEVNEQIWERISRDKIQTIEIAEGVKNFDFGYFCGVHNLKKLIIPQSLNMNGLDLSCLHGDVEFVLNRADYVNENGIIYSADKTELYYFARKNAKSFVVPASVKKIAPYAFTGASEVDVDLSLAKSLEEIGAEAFLHSHMKNVVIPRKVKVIKRLAFGGCPLETIAFLSKGSNLTIAEEAFRAKGATKRTIYVPGEQKLLTLKN
ncbi:hypothetical protein FACS1894198_3030 [Clostridia bacterium]|nr:hypothetical protein FACS1894198_3030 [Clostridia bacterium]